MVSLTRRSLCSAGSMAIVSLALGSLALGQEGYQPDGAEPAQGASAAVPLAGVVVNGATFWYPNWWELDLEVTGSMRAHLLVLARDTLAHVGDLQIIAGDAPQVGEGEDPLAVMIQELYPDAILGIPGVGNSVAALGGDVTYVWGLDHTISQVGISGVASVANVGEGSLRLGQAHASISDDGRTFALTYEVDAAAVADVAALASDVWESAGWWAPPAGQIQAQMTSQQGSGRFDMSSAPDPTTNLDAYKQWMLQQGVAANQANPFYNPYWSIVGFDCDLVDLNTANAHVENERFKFSTAQAFEAWENELIIQATHAGGHSFDHWCMTRVDSSGDTYYRTSADIPGYGVVDIAFYPGYSDVWYVAMDGKAVYTDESGAWYVYAGQYDSAWQSYFLE